MVGEKQLSTLGLGIRRQGGRHRHYNGPRFLGRGLRWNPASKNDLDLAMNPDWSEGENRLIVESYFEMLLKESQGRYYNKTEHRRTLKPKLLDRTDSALEFKHRNISAVLVRMGLPYIEGYIPADNLQGPLQDVVRAYVGENGDLIPALLKAAAQSVPNNARPDLKEEEAPRNVGWVSSTPMQSGETAYSQVDYLLKEQENRMLGQLGEEAVVRYEKNRLAEKGRNDLADRIEWTAREKGDWAGYDIRSFDYTGDPLFIEVKTTKHAKDFPFFITANEVACSERHADAYCLYRVFSFRQSPKFYMRRGPVANSFSLHPRIFEARPEQRDVPRKSRHVGHGRPGSHKGG